MSSLGTAGGLVLAIGIGVALLGFILYLNSLGAYGSMSITPTVNAFGGAIAIFAVALVLVLAKGR